MDGQLAHDPNNGALLAVYSAERGHLGQLASGMVTSKTDDRRSKLNEQTVTALEVAIVATLRDFGLDPQSQRVRRTIGRHLGKQAWHSDAYTREDVLDAEVVSGEPVPEPVQF
ncbi:hypothetical protein O2W15_02160 [Modestobacter sp. VKM Ac-2979]|uniref:hypothetical protein n=1 Tax=unclassified Modestobacter TaxID=2643866 RepID=UPI0022AB89ED|nr:MULTISPECIES: hypothetical protein [unclassified Modestobacter]MCZ2810230.1 hypothetical protein [Modestobacter sp. VKM Ac-2979]MCZ2841716.1 hypothetical protein [Modestobacter sp. VKM Ac-2980]